MQGTEIKKVFKPGDIIMKQGDKGDCAYMIEEGLVEILVEKSDKSAHVVGTRGPGSLIGEMALVDSAPRTATVRAVENCKLLVLTQGDFSGRLEKADSIVNMVTKVILTRYRDTLMRLHIGGHSDDISTAEALEHQYTDTSQALESVKLANDFKEGLKNKDVYLHYQPIIDLKSDQVRGFEALMRWEHPQKGFISPGVFIPVLEESGLIVEASQWALKESLMALKRIENRSGHDNELFMSVNFSSRDFASEGFTELVYDIISKSDVDPHNVHLEITERLLMGQPEQAKETLDICRKAGMHISLDDFGTGYSSLSYLHFFPIDTLKIDRCFVKDIDEDENVLKLVKAIVDLANSMGMQTIAEGVETETQASFLAGLGCDMVQGFYFAKPMSELDVTNFVKGQR